MTKRNPIIAGILLRDLETPRTLGDLRRKATALREDRPQYRIHRAGGRRPARADAAGAGASAATAVGRADRAGMNRAIWLAYAVFGVALILIAAVLLGLLPV